MKKEAFQAFIKELCVDLTKRKGQPDVQWDFTWRTRPSQLVSQLLTPEMAQSFLSQLSEQDTVKFKMVTSRKDPEFRRLIVSEENIKNINESIVRKLNERYKVSVPGKKEFTWKQITAHSGESLTCIDLQFSFHFDYDCSDEKLNSKEIGCVFRYLAGLQEKLKSRYGIMSTYEDHKHGDFFSLTEVSYAAYKNLFRGGSRLLDILLDYSILNNAPDAEKETVEPSATMQLS